METAYVMSFEISNIGIVTAVAAGAVSFLSPCVLPLVPGYVSFIAGNSGRSDQATRNSTGAVWLLSLCFIFGFTTVVVGLGASATLLSRILRSYSYEAGIVGGLIVILFGTVMTGVVKLPGLERDLRFHGKITGGNTLGPISWDSRLHSGGRPASARSLVPY